MAGTDNLTILFVDMVGFTERTSLQSREQNRSMLWAYNRLLLSVITGYGGRHVKSIGDALLVTFRSPTDGVRCGMALIDAVAEFSSGRPVEEQIHIRVALNVGEVRQEGRDVFGEAVNVAARVEGLTPPDEIYFTEAVYLSMNKAEVPSEPLGERKLKGIPEPVRVFRVPARQVTRLVPGGEDLIQMAGELPFGGMHRLVQKPGLRSRIASLGRELPELTHRIRQLHTQPRLLAGIALAVLVLSAGIFGVMREGFVPELLKSVSPAHLQESAAALAAGHEAFSAGSRKDAVAAYTRALESNPELKNDPVLAGNLVAGLSYASDRAIVTIRKYPSAAMIDALARRTAQPGRLGGQRAAQLLEELGAKNRIDRYHLAHTALNEGVKCEDRLDAVRQLRALGDRRAIPVLRQVSGWGLTSLLKNSCLRDEARLTLDELGQR